MRRASPRVIRPISGTTATNSGGLLAGTGATGGPVTVDRGGTITAGTGATTAGTVGALATGPETWAAGGTVYAKVNAGTVTSGGGGPTGDQLVMSGLTVAGTRPSRFVVDLVGLGGSPTVFTAGAQLVLATVPAGTAGTCQNGLGTLTLATSNVTVPAGDAGARAEVDSGTNVELILEVVTAPEPGSLLLAAAAMALGRRRLRRGRPRRSGWAAMV